MIHYLQLKFAKLDRVQIRLEVIHNLNAVKTYQRIINHQMEKFNLKVGSEFNAKEAFKEKIESINFSESSYFFRSMISDGRKHCLDKCLKNLNSDVASTNEKSCVSRCMDAYIHVELSSLTVFKTASVLADLEKKHLLDKGRIF